MAKKEVDLVVAVPNTGFWRDETAKSMVLMFSYFGQPRGRVPGVPAQRISILTVQGSMIAAQRHMCIKKACQDPRRTHLLFIDADMEFPMDLATRLLAHEKDVVGANCTTRNEPILPVALNDRNERIDSRGRTGLEKVQHVGAAILLLRLDIFRERLKPPFFLSDWVPAMQNYCGEDVYLCHLLQQHGVDVWIDHTLSREIGHVGTRVYRHSDITVSDVAHA